MRRNEVADVGGGVCLSVLEQFSLLVSHFVGSPEDFLHLPPVGVIVSYKPRLLHGFHGVGGLMSRSLIQMALKGGNGMFEFIFIISNTDSTSGALTDLVG